GTQSPGIAGFSECLSILLRVQSQVMVGRQVKAGNENGRVQSASRASTGKETAGWHNRLPGDEAEKSQTGGTPGTQDHGPGGAPGRVRANGGVLGGPPRGSGRPERRGERPVPGQLSRLNR